MLLSRSSSSSKMSRKTLACSTTAYKMVPTLPQTFVPSFNETSTRERLEAGNGWKVVLLIDDRELKRSRERERVRQILQQRLEGNVEITRLPAGDYVWVARKYYPGPNSDGEEVVVEERVLDFCVERKRFTELEQSLTEKSKTYPLHRMETQMRQLRYSGISRITICVEGSSISRRWGMQDYRVIKLAHSFVQELGRGMYTGFLLHQTSNVDATVEYLVRVHNELQRDLPLAKARTLDEMKKSVGCAMSCPKFCYYCSLLSISKVAEKSALAIMKRFPSEEALSIATPDQIQSCGEKRKLSGTVVESILSKFRRNPTTQDGFIAPATAANLNNRKRRIEQPAHARRELFPPPNSAALETSDDDSDDESNKKVSSSDQCALASRQCRDSRGSHVSNGTESDPILLDDDGSSCIHSRSLSLATDGSHQSSAKCETTFVSPLGTLGNPLILDGEASNSDDQQATAARPKRARLEYAHVTPS